MRLYSFGTHMARKRKRPNKSDIPTKANHILNLVLVALLLIALRCWHLAVVQHDQRVEMAARPQEKVVIEPAKRGTIRDRTGRPLAINKVQYQAAILTPREQLVATSVVGK